MEPLAAEQFAGVRYSAGNFVSRERNYNNYIFVVVVVVVVAALLLSNRALEAQPKTARQTHDCYFSYTWS